MRRLFLLDGRLHPAWRIALYLLAALIGSVAVQVVLVVVYTFAAAALAWLTGDDSARLGQALASGDVPPPLLALLSLSGLLWALVVTWAFRRWLDQASLGSLGFARQGLWGETAWGLGGALASMGLILVIHLTLGWAEVGVLASASQVAGVLLVMFLALLPAAAIEEIVFRGYVLQTLEAWRGWRLALVVSSLLFGLAHFFNPSFGGLPLANLVLAGAAFGLMYRLTRRLWLPIAYHFMWNYAQGPLFGFRVSGLNFETILQTETTGPALWTGGAFGPEGGLIVTSTLLLLIGLLAAWEARHTTRNKR